MGGVFQGPPRPWICLAQLQRSGMIKRFRFSRRVEACRPVVEALLEMPLR
jgi:hypothetical protein